MKNYQRCTRCVMDNVSDNTIHFYEDGTCNYCTEALKRMANEYFPNNIRKKRLDNIISTIKQGGKIKSMIV